MCAREAAQPAVNPCCSLPRSHSPCFSSRPVLTQVSRAVRVAQLGYRHRRPPLLQSTDHACIKAQASKQAATPATHRVYTYSIECTASRSAANSILHKYRPGAPHMHVFCFLNAKSGRTMTTARPRRGPQTLRSYNVQRGTPTEITVPTTRARAETFFRAASLCESARTPLLPDLLESGARAATPRTTWLAATGCARSR